MLSAEMIIAVTFQRSHFLKIAEKSWGKCCHSVNFIANALKLLIFGGFYCSDSKKYSQLANLKFTLHNLEMKV